jgi:hypothetical protein
MTETTLRQRLTVAAVAPWGLGCAVAIAGWALTSPRPPPGLPLLVVAALSGLGLALLAGLYAWARGARRVLARWCVLTPLVGLVWTAVALLLSWADEQPGARPGLLVLGLQVGAALTALGLLGQEGLAGLDGRAARVRRGRVEDGADDRLRAALRGLRPDDPGVW